jgi:hypothetical protein
MKSSVSRYGWFGLGLLLIGSLAIFLGEQLYIRITGIPATGIISDTYRVRGSTYNRVRFTTSAGENYEFSAPFSFRQYTEGETVTVVYLKEHPTKAVMIRPVWDDLPLCIVLPMIAYIGLRCLRHGWRNVPIPAG